MADRMTAEQRHRCMSHIRSRDTAPEVLVRKALFASGFRFRVNVASLPGTPDIVLGKYRTAVFVNGCFWHGHEHCRLYSIPKTNTGFWMQKIQRNRRRDAAVAIRLQARGWKVVTVWECSLDTAHRKETLEALAARIRKNGEEYMEGQAARKAALQERRAQAAASKARKNSLSEEIYSRYHVPRRIRKASEDYECGYDIPSGTPDGQD